MQNQLNKVIDELKLRNYSRKTIKNYTGCLKEYFSFNKNFHRLDIDNVKRFLLKKQGQGYAPQTINLYLNSIKFFYREIVKSSQKINIKYAKKTKRLPVILSREEIIKIIKIINNPKHKLLISLAYGAGLRVSEIVNLKIKDVQLKDLTLHIKQSKGKKDRITVFPQKLRKDLQNLLVEKDKNDYLFESERGGKLTARTAQKVFENALKNSGIKKEASFHCLRHSFATHLLENGVNIRYVQELLGHQNIRTTQVYTRVTNPSIKNIKSPLS